MLKVVRNSYNTPSIIKYPFWQMPEEARVEFLDLIGRARKKEMEEGEHTYDINVLARERDRKDIHALLTHLERQFHEIEGGTLVLWAWDARYGKEIEKHSGVHMKRSVIG